MTLITLAIAGYIALGWIGCLIKSSGAWLTIGLLWVVFFPLATWLKVDPELLFLYSVSAGALAYPRRWGLSPRSFHLLFALFLIALGIHWYLAGFIALLKLFLLACVGSIVIQLPLIGLPNYYEKITIEGQVGTALILGMVSSINVFVFYFLYWKN